MGSLSSVRVVARLASEDRCDGAILARWRRLGKWALSPLTPGRFQDILALEGLCLALGTAIIIGYWRRRSCPVWFYCWPS